MRDVCAFALATGARMTEILTLTWDKIDLSRNISVVSSDIAKSGRARSLLLGEEALSIIAKRREKQLSPYVFHRGKGKRIAEIDRSDFNRARDAILMIFAFTICDTLGRVGTFKMAHH